MLPVHKYWSVWASVALAVLAAIEPHIPAIHAALPPSWAAGFAVLIVLLRAIPQPKK